MVLSIRRSIWTFQKLTLSDCHIIRTDCNLIVMSDWAISAGGAALALLRVHLHVHHLWQV